MEFLCAVGAEIVALRVERTPRCDDAECDCECAAAHVDDSAAVLGRDLKRELLEFLRCQRGCSVEGPSCMTLSASCCGFIRDGDVVPTAPDIVKCVFAEAVGGKGGLGTLLKGAGRKMGKGTRNFGACRDLSGRRLRHVNDEIALKEYYKEQERIKNAKKHGTKLDPGQFLEGTKSGIKGWCVSTQLLCTHAQCVLAHDFRF